MKYIFKAVVVYLGLHVTAAQSSTPKPLHPVVAQSSMVQEACPAGRSEVNDRKLLGVSRSLQATTAIIDNGVIMIGINDEGNLNVPGSILDGHDGSTTIGLKFRRDDK